MGALRRLFGPSQQAIWRQLSAEIEARYVKGSLWKGDSVQAAHGEWTVTLDAYRVSANNTILWFTRVRAPFVNPDGFRFSVYRQSPVGQVAKWLGMQDVQVGHEQFDRDFIIKGSDETQLRKLFSNSRVRELIAAQPDIHLAVQDDDGWFGSRFPEGVDELHFTAPGMITDVERLKLLYELFGATLDQLCRIGSAYEGNPNVAV